MNGTIYMRISPNGEMYIGQTSKKEIVRWGEHVRDSKRVNNPSLYNCPLSIAIRKYGKDSFSVKILESNIDTSEDLNQREIYWIKKYNTLFTENEKGLNATIGGDGHRLYDGDDFRELYNKGLSLMEIAEIYRVSPRTVSANIESTKQENYKRARAYYWSKNPIRILSCYDITTCKKVKTFNSIAEAAEFFTGNRASENICNVLHGKTLSAYGYFWKYDDQPIDVIYKQKERYFSDKNSARKIAVVNTDTNERFKSIRKAMKTYGISYNQIKNCCEGNKETAGGYHWKYATDLL